MRSSGTARHILQWLFLGTISGISFLTMFGAIVSPLPLVYGLRRYGRGTGLLCLVLNAGVVLALAGALYAITYVLVCGVMAFTLSELFTRKVAVERAISIATAAVLIASAAALIGWSARRGIDPIGEVRKVVTVWTANVAANIRDNKIQLPENSAMKDMVSNPEEMARSILIEFPSALIIGLLLVTILNTIMILKINPDNLWERLSLPETFFQTWKTPVWLVWPVIACGAFLVFEVKGVSSVALNIFKVLMALYFFQGISIVYFFFEQLRVNTFWRIMGYTILVFVFMPLVLSLGFFDLWFDFRARYIQRQQLIKKNKSSNTGGDDESHFT